MASRWLKMCKTSKLLRVITPIQEKVTLKSATQHQEIGKWVELKCALYVFVKTIALNYAQSTKAHLMKSAQNRPIKLFLNTTHKRKSAQNLVIVFTKRSTKALFWKGDAKSHTVKYLLSCRLNRHKIGQHSVQKCLY